MGWHIVDKPQRIVGSAPNAPAVPRRQSGGLCSSTPSVLFNDLSRQTASQWNELSAASARIIASGRYVLGEENDAFEREFADYCGARDAIGVASGTDALELALRAVGVQAGQNVITVANAGGYATAAIRTIGAQPAFVDVRPDTCLIDLTHLKTVIACRKVAAVIVTHLFGRMVDMAAIAALCDPPGIPVIEDCAQAHGAKHDGRRAGSFGAAGCFSFYPTKNLGALGDGGAVVTSNPAIAGRIRSLRQYGWHGKYRVVSPGGRNSRLDELQAAFLRVKLPHLDRWNERRRGIAARYRDGIANPKVHFLLPGTADDVVHLFVIRCAASDALAAHLRAANIGYDIHYPIPDHLQAGWMMTTAPPAALPVTEDLAAQLLSLPCYPELNDDEVESVIRAVNEW